MKVEGELEPGDEPYEACVILAANKKRGAPHEYDHEHIKNLPLLEIRDALIVPGDFGDGSELPDAGDLVQTSEGFVLTISRSEDYGRGGVESINLASGRILKRRPQQDFLTFKAWKIILPSPTTSQGATMTAAIPLKRWSIALLREPSLLHLWLSRAHLSRQGTLWRRSPPWARH